MERLRYYEIADFCSALTNEKRKIHDDKDDETVNSLKSFLVQVIIIISIINQRIVTTLPFEHALLLFQFWRWFLVRWLPSGSSGGGCCGGFVPDHHVGGSGSALLPSRWCLDQKSYTVRWGWLLWLLWLCRTRTTTYVMLFIASSTTSMALSHAMYVLIHARHAGHSLDGIQNSTSTSGCETRYLGFVYHHGRVRGESHESSNKRERRGQRRRKSKNWSYSL